MASWAAVPVSATVVQEARGLITESGDAQGEPVVIRLFAALQSAGWRTDYSRVETRQLVVRVGSRTTYAKRYSGKRLDKAARDYERAVRSLRNSVRFDNEPTQAAPVVAAQPAAPVVAARATAPKAAPAPKMWRCSASHGNPEDAEVCRRAHGAVRYWDKAPGYVADEIEAERSKPSTLPKVGGTIRDWAAIWHEGYREIQKRPVVVVYDTRDELFGALRALALQFVPANGNGASYAA